MSERAKTGERLTVPDHVMAPDDFVILGGLAVSSQELRDAQRLMRHGSVEHTTAEVKASLRERLVTSSDRTFRTEDIMSECGLWPGFDQQQIEVDIIVLEHFCEHGEWLKLESRPLTAEA
jgi:hypothetical protein